MTTEVRNGITVITAEDGYTLRAVDGTMSNQFWLGKNDCIENYTEITEAQAAEILEQLEAEAANNSKDAEPTMAEAETVTDEAQENT